MKRGAVRWRVRDISLMLLVLVCTVFLMWTWDRTPLNSTFVPPENQLLLLPTETNKASSDSRTPPRVEVSSTGEASLDNTDGKNYSRQKSETKESDSYTSTTSSEKEETSANVSDLSKSIQKIDEEKQGSNIMVGIAENEPKLDDNEKNLDEERKSSDIIESANKTIPIKDNDNSTMHEGYQACNFAKGKWVVDTRRPLYSGFGCKQWLASMWACRLMQRKDFAFENLRWQPKECEMENFDRFKFLERTRNKAVAFVGDSLGRQQFQSLMCMITGGKERSDVLDVGPEYGLVTPVGGGRPNGWAYRFPETNTTVLYHWSSTLCDIEPINITNPNTEYAMHLDRPPAFLREYLHKIHVLVLNTGHHWNRGKLNGNRWVMHVRGVPNTNRKLAALGDAKNFTIHSIISWVNSQLPRHPDLKAFYRSISPRHFMGGEWNTGGSCNNTTPMSIGKEVLQDESSDYSAGRAVKGTGVKLLDITALSQVRDEGHISRFSLTASPGVQDCLHWCLPGIPDTWNELLFAQI